MRRLYTLLMGLLAATAWLATSARAVAIDMSPVVVENMRQGSSNWRLYNIATAGQIEGYASLTSVDRGGQINLYVRTDEPSHTIEIYRMGWYGGAGGRLMMPPIVRNGAQSQVIPAPNPITGMIECNWTNPYTLTIPNDPDPSVWPSGYYLAKLTAGTSGAQSYIVFVVRDDDRPAHFLMQSSVTTFQAYNNWGGKSLYDFQSPTGRASKVSFNRPYGPFNNYVEGLGSGQFMHDGEGAPPGGWEYNMVRFLEKEGVDVAYCTDLDTHQNPNLLLNHEMFLIAGHDEYWSRQMRTNLIAARDAGVHIGVFSANTMYWQVRFEPGVTGAPNRTMVCYKGTPNGTVSDGTQDPYYLDADPSNDQDISVRFRDSLPGSTRVALPEEAILGCQYIFGADSVNSDLVVADASHSIFTGTGLVNGSTIPGVVGYEADSMQGNQPPGTIALGASPINVPAGAVSHMTIYTAASGAVVFNTGSIQWAWGLDDFNVPRWRPSRLSAAAQQITRNVLYRTTGVPIAAAGGRYRGAVGASIQFDSAGSLDYDGTLASYEWDFGDGTTGVGQTSSHVYALPGRYPVVLTVTDNDGKSSSKGTWADVGQPLSLWDNDTQPALVDWIDQSQLELGVRFRSEINGFIVGVRFHKDSANGRGMAHTGSLWTNTGTLLATGTFTNETAYGWQELRFATPVPITANTTYVASYFTPRGGYSYTNGYFASSGYDNPPLHAPQDGIQGLNGCYNAGAPGFPSQSYQSTHYWVDVMFLSQLDVTPPTVTGVSPTAGATNVLTNASVTAAFNEPMDPATITTTTFELRDAANNLVAGTVSYNAANKIAAFQPNSPLAGATTYTATLKGGLVDPRMKDLAGNALASDYTWSFTTVASDNTPPTVTAVSPAAGATNVAVNTAVTATFSEAMNAATINGTTFELRNPANTLVTATVTYDAATKTAKLQPSSALSGATTYTATVKGGATDPRVKDLVGNALATNKTWTFTTVDSTPPTVSSVGPSAGATNVPIMTNVTATFSEAMDPATINTSTFELRNSAGTLVTATVSYDAGARTATLDPSSNLAPSTVYTVKIKGGTVDPRVKDLAGNALINNFTWSFTTAAPDVTAPTVTAVSPASGATNVSVTAAVTATFSEAMNAATINTTTYELRNAAGTLITATVTYDATTRTAKLQPSSPLASKATYTAKVKGGTIDPRVKDLAGNALATNKIWSFTTQEVLRNIFSASATPQYADSGDGTAVEVGVKFKSDVSGYIKGIRFYKGAGNTGTHIGSLWSLSGTRLRQATFTSETATGWQEVRFSSPVAITAGTVYVASYFAPRGHTAINVSQFAAAGVDNAPLHALKDGTSGVNGVYRVTGSSAFPYLGYYSSNFWVDVVFSTNP